MSKKILSVALALIFVISTFAVSAFAVGGTAFEEDPAAYTQAWSLAELDSDTEGTYKVGVYLDASYLVGAVQFQIVNEDGNAILGGVESGLFTDGDFDIQYTEDGLVFIVPTPADNAATAVDTATTDTLIATLSYTLKEGASSATLAIADDAKSETNPGGSLIAVRMSDDNLVTGTMIYGQEATVGEAITIGAAAAPADLALTDAGSTAGVIIDTNKTFGGAYAGVVYGFTQAATTTFRTEAYLTNALQVTNGGSWTVGRTLGTAGFGTGTTLTIKNSDGSETGKVYVVVIFGDANGDGLLNGNDTSAIKAAVQSAANAPQNSVKRMACNVQAINNATMVHTLNGNDTTAMKNHVQGTAKMNPVTLATYQNNHNNFYQ